MGGRWCGTPSLANTYMEGRREYPVTHTWRREGRDREREGGGKSKWWEKGEI